MLKMRRRLVILRYNCPAVRFSSHAIPTLIEHWFDRNNHTRFQLYLASSPVVIDKGVFVIVVPDAVPAIIPDKSVSILLGDVFNCAPDIIKRAAGSAGFDALVKRTLSFIQKCLQ